MLLSDFVTIVKNQCGTGHTDTHTDLYCEVFCSNLCWEIFSSFKILEVPSGRSREIPAYYSYFSFQIFYNGLFLIGMSRCSDCYGMESPGFESRQE
jgi:hypothetical protein